MIGESIRLRTYKVLGVSWRTRVVHDRGRGASPDESVNFSEKNRSLMNSLSRPGSQREREGKRERERERGLLRSSWSSLTKTPP